jgi:hypothetical protein
MRGDAYGRFDTPNLSHFTANCRWLREVRRQAEGELGCRVKKEKCSTLATLRVGYNPLCFFAIRYKQLRIIKWTRNITSDLKSLACIFFRSEA